MIKFSKCHLNNTRTLDHKDTTVSFYSPKRIHAFYFGDTQLQDLNTFSGQ